MKSPLISAYNQIVQQQLQARMCAEFITVLAPMGPWKTACSSRWDLVGAVVGSNHRRYALDTWSAVLWRFKEKTQRFDEYCSNISAPICQNSHSDLRGDSAGQLRKDRLSKRVKLTEWWPITADFQIVYPENGTNYKPVRHKFAEANRLSSNQQRAKKESKGKRWKR